MSRFSRSSSAGSQSSWQSLSGSPGSFNASARARATSGVVAGSVEAGGSDSDDGDLYHRPDWMRAGLPTDSEPPRTSAPARRKSSAGSQASSAGRRRVSVRQSRAFSEVEGLRDLGDAAEEMVVVDKDGQGVYFDDVEPVARAPGESSSDDDRMLEHGSMRWQEKWWRLADKTRSRYLFFITMDIKFNLYRQVTRVLVRPPPLKGRALLLFGPDNPVRKAARSLLYNPASEAFVTLVVILSTVSVAVMSPSVMSSGHWAATALEALEVVFVVVFGVEWILNAVIRGLFLTKHGMLRDPWMRLDTLVMVTSLLQITGGLMPGVRTTFLRSLRAFRVLRVVDSMEGVRAIWDSLSLSMHHLYNASILFLTAVFVYIIIGVEMYKGRLDHRCVMSATGDLVVPTHYCHESCPVAGAECRYVGNPNNGITSFDNAWSGLLLSFQVISMDDWSDLLTATEQSTGVSAVMYYLSEVLVFNFLLVNLLIAILSTYFSKVRKAQRALSFSASTRKSWSFNVWLENRLSRSRVGRGVLAMVDRGDLQCLVPECAGRAAGSVVNNVVFEYFVNCMIAANLVVLAMPYHGMSDGYALGLEVVELVFTVFFLVEMVLRVISHRGTIPFLAESSLNRVDFVVVLSSSLSTIVQLAAPNLAGPGSALSALRVLRIARVVRLVLRIEGLTELLRKSLGSLEAMVNLVFFLIFILCLHAIAGVQLYGDTDRWDTSDIRVNYKNFPMGCLSGFQVLTGSDWAQILYVYVGTSLLSRVVAFLFFVGFFCLGNYILLNIFVCIILENFDISEREKEEKRILAMKAEPVYAAIVKTGDPTVRLVFEREMKGSLEEIAGEALETRRASKRSSHKSSLRNPSIREVGDEHPATVPESDVLPSFTLGAAGTDTPVSGSPPSSGAKEGMMARIQSLVRSDPAPEQTLHDQLINVTPNSRRGSPGVVRNSLGGGADAPAVHVPSHKLPRWSSAHSSLCWPCLRWMEYLNSTGRADYSLLFFHKTNPLRRLCTYIAHHILFHIVVFSAIGVSAILIVVDTYVAPGKETGPPGWVYTYAVINILYVLLFTAEFAIKVLADGLYFTDTAYLRTSFWNVYDTVILLAMWVELLVLLGEGTLTSHAKGVVVAFRLARVIRLLSMVKSVKAILFSLATSMVEIGYVSTLFFVFLFVFSTMGIVMYSGRLSSCNEVALDRAGCVGSFLAEESGVLVPRVWASGKQSFDSFPKAMLALFEIATLDDWQELMFITMDISPTSKDAAPTANASWWHALFFILFIGFVTYFCLNLLVGVIVESINQYQGRALLSVKQLAWHDLRSHIRSMSPEPAPDPPGNCLRRVLFIITHHALFNIFIMLLILINSIVMVFEHEGQPEEFGVFVEVLSIFSTTIFTLEILAKVIAVNPKVFFKDKWNIFDTVVVSISLFGVLARVAFPFRGEPTYVRILRVVRIFRLVKRFRVLQMLFDALLASAPAVANIGVLITMVIFVYAVLGNRWFGAVRYGLYLNEGANFRSLHDSILVLLRIATADGWAGVLHDTAVLPPHCTNTGDLNDCGSELAYPYFLSFCLIGTFIIVNLTLAAVIENFTHFYNSSWHDISIVDLRQFKETWALYDPRATGYIPIFALKSFVFDLGRPLGFDRDHPRDVLACHFVYHYAQHKMRTAYTRGLHFRRVMELLVMTRLGLGAHTGRPLALVVTTLQDVIIDRMATLVAATFRGHAVRMEFGPETRIGEIRAMIHAREEAEKRRWGSVTSSHFDRFSVWSRDTRRRISSVWSTMTGIPGHRHEQEHGHYDGEADGSAGMPAHTRASVAASHAGTAGRRSVLSYVGQGRDSVCESTVYDDLVEGERLQNIWEEVIYVMRKAGARGFNTSGVVAEEPSAAVLFRGLAHSVVTSHIKEKGAWLSTAIGKFKGDRGGGVGEVWSEDVEMDVGDEDDEGAGVVEGMALSVLSGSVLSGCYLGTSVPSPSHSDRSSINTHTNATENPVYTPPAAFTPTGALRIEMDPSRGGGLR